MRTQLSPSKLESAEQGAVLVEFAILVPFLMLLLIGIAEIGYLYFHLNILNKSVQDAGLYFSDSGRARKDGVYEEVIDVSDGDNITATKNLAIYGKPSVGDSDSPILPYNDSADMVVTVYCAAGDDTATGATCKSTTEHIRVTAVYNHPFMLGGLINDLCILVGNSACFPDAEYPLSASAVFRVEGGST
jgi:Flp pilus assembly protein TadG